MEAQPTKEEALREKIVQVAQQLFQHYGLRKVTMDDIARAAGRGKSGLYYYYKSKDEIFDVVLDREINAVLRQLMQEVDQVPTASAKLEAYALTKVKLLRERSALYSILYHDIYQYYSLDFVNRIHLRFQANETTAIKRILASGMASNEFRQLSAEEMTQVALVIVTSLYGFEQEMHTDESSLDLEAKLKLLMELLAKGLKP